MNIEQLFLDYEGYAEKLKEHLQAMLSVVVAGMVPIQTDTTELVQSINMLRQKYDAVYQAAQSELPIEDLPEESASAYVYIEAMRNHEASKLRKRLEQAKICLQQFMAIRSLVVAYAEELKPFQAEAATLLKQLCVQKTSVSESIEHLIAGPQALLKALNCEDLDSTEGLALIDDVGVYYPRRVQMGVAAGKYFIDEHTNNSNDTLPAANTPPTDNLSHALPADAIASVAEVCEQPESNASAEDLKDSAFVQEQRTQSTLIDTADALGEVISNIHSNENKKISTSIFINELKTGPLTVEKVILREIFQEDCINLRWLTEVHGIPQDKALFGLKYLFNKGYLHQFGLAPERNFYCASPRLEKALTHQEGCKFVGLRRRPLESWGEHIQPDANNVATRIALTELSAAWALCYRNSHNDDGFFSQYRLLTNSAYKCLRKSADASSCELIISAFGTSAEEYDDFLDALQHGIDRYNRIAKLIIAGTDLSHTQAFAKSLLETLNAADTTTIIFLYVFPEQTYYTYPELECVDEEAAFATESNLATSGDPNTLLPDKGAATSPIETNSQPLAPLAKPEQDVCSSDIETKSECPPEPESHLQPEPQSHSDLQTESPLPPSPTPTSSHVIQQPTSSCSSKTKERDAHLYQMIDAQQLYAASAYLWAQSASDKDSSRLRRQLAYAVNDPMEHCSYSALNAFELISEQTPFENALVISTAIRVFFSNQVQYDNMTKSFYDSIREYTLLSQFPILSTILYNLMQFKVTYQKGLDAYAEYHVKSYATLTQALQNIQRDASSFYDNFVAGYKKEKCSLKRFLETKKLMFSPDSEIGQHIQSIKGGAYNRQPAILNFLRTHFYKEDAVLAEDTFDINFLWKYIEQFWEQAGDHMAIKYHDTLKSRLRSNITNETVKAVQLMAKWCILVEKQNTNSEGKGTAAYKILRSPLIKRLGEAIQSIDTACTNMPISGEKAGLQVINYTLHEVNRCLNGSFHENSAQYYYAPFLLTDDIVLDKDFLPDLDVHASTLPTLQPIYRILSHAQQQTTSNTVQDYITRLNTILNEQGDDYGSAEQIAEYIAFIDPSKDLSDYLALIESGVNYAKEAADLRKTDFIGELELAQSYGQIDNSVENQKEKILQIVDDWYEWATETANYGFFQRVMKSYLLEIKETSKTRENKLREQLDKFCAEPSFGLSMEAKKHRIAHIQAMMQAQNYTVAEDLLAHATTQEDEYEERIEEDFLREFLDNYDDYYTPVARQSVSFSTLVGNRTRNKEERGAKRLVSNWLPGGGNMSRERLTNLLEGFGFKVDSIRQQEAIGKFENFIIVTKSAANGQRENYEHPIAIFGSAASRDGFRVICVNGIYDADGLIDIMKRIGNAKHALILLDYALPKSERRRLARKSKNALSDKFFGVIDRTIMMFLVRKFDETKINRMLISLIMPFGYYQPYVWESVNVMPPEMFMGRKNELERIKAQTGVNIVYGGRQLGKSALLKRAKAEIDQNENGDRAVYVDIKGKNYEEAARKISHELYDQKILDEDLNTGDWDELARAIRLRLQSPKLKHIPYLLLLLDEADIFIESCETIDYKPFDSLKEIQGIGEGRFKFVIAGLHNIVRFKREAVLGNNCVLPHLQFMTVKPFNTSEARELMEIPLHYLGLDFPQEKESLITLILATTNYFPGLIQMYCAKLLEAMRNKDYAGYNEVDSPIYEISEGHIKKVLADPEFMKEIREKYLITLKLGEDNYYYLIALLMAFLYHNNGYNEGYTAADIRKAGTELSITRIAKMDEVRLAAFMEEMKELNVLRSTDEKHYLFTRVTFFQMLGTRDEIEDVLVDYMGE